MSLNSSTMHKQNKIKRSDLVEQLRDNQIRSKFNWASVYFSSTANLSSSYSRMDMMMFVLWELLILTFIVSSAVSLYLTHWRLTLTLAIITLLLLLCLKVTKQAKLNRKNKRRMLLPLSMQKKFPPLSTILHHLWSISRSCSSRFINAVKFQPATMCSSSMVQISSNHRFLIRLGPVQAFFSPF